MRRFARHTGVYARRRGPAPPRARPAFTLLELMLALALTAVILALINMAIELHLRTVDARRRNVEESQLARALLRIMADDVRATVQAYEQDVSGVEAMIQQAAAAAAAGAVSGGGSQASGSSGSGGSGGSTGGPYSDASSSQGSSTTSSRTGSGSSTSQGSSSGGQAASGSGSAGGGGSMGASMSSSTSSSGGEESQATTDLTAVSVPEVPGLYGNQYQLQVDVSRLPRVEEYQQLLSADALTSITDIPSDVKTVTYYVQTPAAVGAGAAAPVGSLALESLEDPDAHAVGLVRRELDRAVTSTALLNGNTTGLENSGDLLAPEVVGLEFRYFDGVEWRLEWDTSVEKSLPIAVQILLALATDGAKTAEPAANPTGPGTSALPASARLYSLIVHLPTGGAAESGEAATETSSASTGTAVTP